MAHPKPPTKRPLQGSPRRREPLSARPSRRRELAFLTRFLVFGILLFAVYWGTEVTHLFRHVNVANAVLTSQALGDLGVENTQSGSGIAFASGSMEVVSECSAIYVAILFTAGVLAYPTTARARLGGLVLGLPCLFVVNVVRLVTVGLVIRYRASLLPLVHEYLWQVLFTLIVVALYVIWIDKIVRRDETPRPVPDATA